MSRSTLSLAVDEATGPQSAATGTEAHASGLHVAIIMDGNGRWATARGRRRAVGHLAGAKAVRRTVEAAPSVGITTLTLYAFSSDNWRRPRAEVGHLMRLFQRHLDSECARLVEAGVRLSVIGRRDRIPDSLTRKILQVERRTQLGRTLHLRVAIDYSARDALVAAASRLSGLHHVDREAFAEALGSSIHSPDGARDVDLLIRTGGERRLSDFLLWESAYAELHFTDVYWPDFHRADLEGAVSDFAGRDRRFGGIEGDRPQTSDLSICARRIGP